MVTTPGKDFAGDFTSWDAGIARTEDAGAWGNGASWTQNYGGMICLIKKGMIFPLSPRFWCLSLCSPALLRKTYLWCGVIGSNMQGYTVHQNQQEAAVQGEWSIFLLMYWGFSSIMLHEEVLLYNLFWVICFLFVVSHWSCRPEEQAGAANCLPGMAFTCHSVL